MTTATKTTPRGTRLEQAQRTLAERQAELAKISLVVTDSFEAEDAARLAELRAAPTQSTEKAGGLVAKIRSTRERNEVRAEALSRDISGLQRLIEELEQGALEDAVAEEIGRAQELVATERAAWQVFCDKLVVLHAVWSEALLPAMEERDGFRIDTEARHPQIASSEAWSLAVEAPVTPCPVDFLAAFEMVFQTACDTFGRGYRGEGERMDDSRALVDLVPDLRASNRAAVLSGKTAKRSSSAFFAYGNQPVGAGPEVVRAERQDGLTDWHKGGS